MHTQNKITKIKRLFYELGVYFPQEIDSIETLKNFISQSLTNRRVDDVLVNIMAILMLALGEEIARQEDF